MADREDWLIPVPSSAPDEGAFSYPEISEAWIPVITMKLRELQDINLWEGFPSDIIAQIDELIDRMENTVPIQTHEIGEIVAFPFDTLPSKWLLCDGAAVSRSTYAELFALMGTEYGAGDGTTTFNLPNFAGKMILGWDDTVFNRFDETGGEIRHTLTTTEMPAHTHTLLRTQTSGATQSVAQGPGATSNTSLSTGSAGGGGSHNNMPPYGVAKIAIYTGVA